ncbi:MAG: lectin [Dyella sp.]|uniref:lectin n=1 Tax=Dyella sp. TaxID=1869338 RepID=UPI003F804EDB
MKAARLIVLLAATLAGCSGQSGAGAERTPSAAASAPAPSATAMAAPAARSTERATENGQSSDGLPRFDGYGDMRFGMDEAAFRRAWQGDLAGTVDAAGGCSVLRPVWVKQPRDFGFLFEQGRFARYDVGTAKEAAPGGGKVGMDVAGIRARYGDRVQAAPHKYVAGAQYLRVAAPDGKSALVFETDAAGKVTRWRVGVPPQIDYVEGCG